MPHNLFDHELAQQIARLTGIRAEYIQVYAEPAGWDASLRFVQGVWTPAKHTQVKRAAAGLQRIYGYKRSAA